MNVEAMQKRMMTLAMVGGIAKAAAWIALCWLCIEGLMHVNEFGLKHLIDTVWFGPSGA